MKQLRDFMKLAVTCSTLTACQFVCTGQVSNQSSASPDLRANDLRTEVQFLIDQAQELELNRLRLVKLKNDSSRIEPVFRSKSAAFFALDREADASPGTTFKDSALLIQKLNYDQRVLDFLLQRRRSVQLQIRILENKIGKDEHLLNLVLQGKSLSVDGRSPHHSDTIPEEDKRDSIQTEQSYRWSVVSAAMELTALKQDLEFNKKQWELVKELLTLNADDLEVASFLKESSQRSLKEWTGQLISLQASLSTEKDDAAIQLLKAFIRESTSIIIPTLSRALDQDSMLVESLEKRLKYLEQFKEPLSRNVMKLMNQVEKKERWVAFIDSPFAPSRIYSSILKHGPRILIILIAMFLIWYGVRWIAITVIKKLKLARYKTAEERAERIETLSRAFKSGLTILFLILTILLILSEAGINISVLLGGAAILSLGIAFGAQSLIKDYFSGFMIISENQYRIGNVIQINNVTGFVEDVTLRMTTLRDLDGIAHFIPHGEIKVVSNYTHGWSQVNLNIRVSYKESVDNLMQIILGVSKELKDDPAYSHFIVAEPEMLGVEAFEDSVLLLKIIIRTLPVKQWIIKREFLRRLKNRFDERGISMALPTHKIVYESSKTDKTLNTDLEKSGKDGNG